MERLVIEGICNKNDAYIKSLTGRNKQTISKFFKKHKADLKEYNIDFLFSDWFLAGIELSKYRYVFNFFIDIFPESLINEFFNKIINYSGYTNYYYTIFQRVSIDKLFVEADAERGLVLIESDIRTLECRFYQKKEGLKEFLNNCTNVNIQRLIIDEPFNFDKEDIERLLLVNGSSVKEIIFKK